MGKESRSESLMHYDIDGMTLGLLGASLCSLGIGLFLNFVSDNKTTEWIERKSTSPRSESQPLICDSCRAAGRDSSCREIFSGGNICGVVGKSDSSSSSSSRAKMDVFEKVLSKIVGLDGLKLQLRRWLKGMLLDEKRRELGLQIGPRRPPHMAFLGNPGTGKTSIARMIGKLLHIVGILPTDKVTEVQRTDLVGEYIGHTGVKTRNKIKEAEGGILFVDEAYRLVPVDSDGDFGKEALDEIMSVMESGNLVVILAGYNQPMERVISSNEGLQRRITNFFYFDDYSCEELASILHHEMANGDENSPMYGYMLHPSCSPEAVAAVIRRDTSEEQRRKMNGGLVDQMLVRAKENLDWRTDVECANADYLLTVTLDDLAAGLKFLEVEKKRDTEIL